MDHTVLTFRPWPWDKITNSLIDLERQYPNHSIARSCRAVESALQFAERITALYFEQATTGVLEQFSRRLRPLNSRSRFHVNQNLRGASITSPRFVRPRERQLKPLALIRAIPEIYEKLDADFDRAIALSNLGSWN